MSIRSLTNKAYKYALLKEVKIGDYNGGLNFIFHGNEVKVRSGKYSYGTLHVYSYQGLGEISIGKYTSISEISVIMGGGPPYRHNYV